MPLYTYVVTYREGSYVAQGRPIQRELLQIAYRGSFTAVPTCQHVWKKVLPLGGHELVVYAIQTDRS